MSIAVRRIALGAIAAAVVAAAVVLPTPPGHAIVPDASTDFVVKAFPHETTTVVFSDSWGARRSGGRSHAGTDIMSPKGTWIVAVEDGIVERLDWNQMSGWNIMVRHADGWTSHYLHLNNDTTGTDDGEGGPDAAFAEGLEVGSFVKAGEVIGFVGDSGNAEHTGSHTHFELHIDGAKVDPYPYLVAAMERKLRESEVRRALQ
jgi:murein DD-endopeptidase MepM/ murein hydrolase activator NlpD